MFNSNPNETKKIDPRIAILIVGAAIIAFFVIVGDQVAFVRPPNNFFENIIGLPASFFYFLMNDRISANICSGLLFTALVGVIAMLLYKWLERKLLQPLQIKNMIETKRREKELINKYGDDTM